MKTSCRVKCEEWKGGFMKRGTHEFRGEKGKHVNKDGDECQGRMFTTRTLSSSGAYLNVVACTWCLCELTAGEDRSLGPAPFPALASVS
jgi:hypothetical protein